MSRDGTPGCRCNVARIDIAGRCVVCGLERLHVLPKAPFVASSPDRWPSDDGSQAAA